MSSRINHCNWPPRLVVVPGLHGSGAAHWQTWLERQFVRPIRIEQADWEHADLSKWCAALERQLAHERGPFVLAAHSFGSLVAAHALGRGLRGVVGALLVAPASPVRFGIEQVLYRRPLGVASVVIGSENDPWLAARDAQALAQEWRASFMNLGPVGHINTASGFGPWPRAKYLVDTLTHWAAPRYLVRDETFAAPHVQSGEFAGAKAGVAALVEHG
ncbi:alpha/beta hydrolase [Trinickia sp. LjRoot230]|uniref:RBBP9/YdeN family alpha/beta hydrolase n=1 Tax=Trinickia sp. LjRoot230 TaxID=3342288 RepID=UPI003ECCF079